uniref:Uncharacterized protein n=1 Tax=Glossina palpalis gambiensis TaxID=67801 RepID=A0A1B0C6V3_9MUSC
MEERDIRDGLKVRYIRETENSYSKKSQAARSRCLDFMSGKPSTFRALSTSGGVLGIVEVERVTITIVL